MDWSCTCNRRCTRAITSLPSQTTPLDLAGALEAVPHGVINVGSDCFEINLNSAAEGILRADDGVHIRSGHITATSTHAERELHCAIHRTLTEDGSKVRRGRHFTGGRPSDKRPYVIHVLPLRRVGVDEPLRQAGILVLIIDPKAGGPIHFDHSMVWSLYSRGKTTRDIGSYPASLDLVARNR
jgi:hypothetical protein